MRRAAVRLSAACASAALASGLACRAPAPRPAGAALPACPRDARPDASGRCACDPGDVLLLGACVPPGVADAYCGPAARAVASGACVFPACGPTDAVDVETGCVPLVGLLHGGPSACNAGTSLIVDERRAACVPADAACPRGTRAEAAACAHPPACPPGTLATARSCRPVVLRGPGGSRLVDLGGWAAVVLGVDGGPASPELCTPVQARPQPWALAPGERLPLALHVVVSAPDGDVTRVRAEVHATPSPSSRPIPPAAATLVERSVATLLEPLRGLGGETTAPRVEVEVRCEVGTAP